MKREELLSIIVPIFNDAPFVETCIDSILNQSYKSIELILVDDGSTDDSLSICQKYKDTDMRVRLIHKENEGPILARYSGLQLARSERVMFVDGDDWISSDMCQILMEVKEDCDSDMVISGLNVYHDINNINPPEFIFENGIYYKTDLEDKIYPHMFWNIERQCFGVNPSLCGKIFTKPMLVKEFQYLKDLKFHYGEDVAIIYPLLLKSNSVIFVNRAFYFHRKRLRKGDAGYIKDELYFEKLLILYNYLKKRYSTSKLSVQLLLQLEYFYMYSVNLKKLCYQDNIIDNKYLFPFNKVKKGSKIVLYGAGQVGQTYYHQLVSLNYCIIVAWIDKNYKKFIDYRVKIVGIKSIESLEYDHIVIANACSHIRQEIINELIEKKVERYKII